MVARRVVQSRRTKGRRKTNNTREFAGIAYGGIAGATHDCYHAVVRLLQYGDEIIKARILSCESSHCLLLIDSIGDLTAIKSGFSSGYGGTGPTYFSEILALLDSHGVEIEEFKVEPTVIERLDQSALTVRDLSRLDRARPIRPSRWPDYVDRDDFDHAHDGTLWRRLRPIIPFAVFDHRLIDLALSFWRSPDANLLSAYKRLEDIVRKRTGLDDHGAKLFSKAFIGANARLHWTTLDEGENQGRAQLFTAVFMAHRNPRAHRELTNYAEEQLRELLLLNHLYRLEQEALVKDPDQPTSDRGDTRRRT